MKVKPKIRIMAVISEEPKQSQREILVGGREWLLDKCPDNLLPDGPVCPQCGKRRGPSGVDGGSWVHY